MSDDFSAYFRDHRSRLGWSRIAVINDDLGRSGGGGVERLGFEQLLMAVCGGKAGVVLSTEAFRFARNRCDWYTLLELCPLLVAPASTDPRSKSGLDEKTKQSYLRAGRILPSWKPATATSPRIRRPYISPSPRFNYSSNRYRSDQ